MQWLNGLIHNNLTSAVTPRVLAVEWRRRRRKKKKLTPLLPLPHAHVHVVQEAVTLYHVFLQPGFALSSLPLLPLFLQLVSAQTLPLLQRGQVELWHHHWGRVRGSDLLLCCVSWLAVPCTCSMVPVIARSCPTISPLFIVVWGDVWLCVSFHFVGRFKVCVFQGWIHPFIWKQKAELLTYACDFLQNSLVLDACVIFSRVLLKWCRYPDTTQNRLTPPFFFFF